MNIMSIDLNKTPSHLPDVSKAFAMCAKGSQGLSTDIRTDSLWWIAMEGRVPVGCASAYIFAETPCHVRYKQDVVRPHYRGRGIYRKLWDARNEYFKNDHPLTPTKYSAICTPFSEPLYRKEGFVGEISETKGTYYMTRICK